MTIVQDQSDTITFLKADPEQREGELRIIATHASLIFLASDRVYKLKRAVQFPFLDFSTAEKRVACCRTEVELNKRTAPKLYIGVRMITREPDGRLVFDGTGEVIDAVVEMFRFKDECLFDNLAQHDALTPALMTRLARHVAAFHKTAAVSKAGGGETAMARVLELNAEALRASAFPAAEVADLLARFQAALSRNAPTIDRRRENGKVRRCHGDLILRNICLFDDEPTLFDCLEFDEDLATIDVLYDLAFLLMDLWHRDQHDLANLVFNRYLDEANETDGLALLPFFMAVRAGVRAHVTATQANEAKADRAVSLREEAQAYLDLARRLLEQQDPLLVAVGGLSGSGKSTVAAAVAPHMGGPPGARVLASDRIRKTLHGVAAETRLNECAYTSEISRKVYESARDYARGTLKVGWVVVVDAVFDRAEERTAIESVARETTVRFAGFWLEAPIDVLIARVDQRANDPSDATAEVVRAQSARAPDVIGWERVDARNGVGQVREFVLAFLRADHAIAAPNVVQPVD